MVLCLLLQMLLTKPATMITIMINERMMIRIMIMIMVMQTGVVCTSERTAKPCSSRDGPAHVWSTECLCCALVGPGDTSSSLACLDRCSCNMGRKKQLYDIIHCSFFEKADKEGHLVVTLPPHYHHMATTGAGGSLYARRLSQHLVAVFVRLSRQRGNTSLFERRVAGHLRFKGRGRDGKTTSQGFAILR